MQDLIVLCIVLLLIGFGIGVGTAEYREKHLTQKVEVASVFDSPAYQAELDSLYLALVGDQAESVINEMKAFQRGFHAYCVDLAIAKGVDPSECDVTLEAE